MRINDPNNQQPKRLLVEVISEEAGICYEGRDYYHGDRFECDERWVGHFVQINKVRPITAEILEREQAALKTAEEAAKKGNPQK